MSIFNRKKRSESPGACDDGSLDTRTRDVVTHLSTEITRLMGVTEQLQDLIETISQDKGPV